MRLVKLPLAACILVASGVAGPAVEMTRPFEALEQSRRAMIELDKRQKREGVERLKQDKQNEAERKREEAEQRKRERAEKAQQETQPKRTSADAKTAQGARPSPISLPSAPALADKLSPQPSTAPLQATRQAAEGQPLVQNASPARPQVGAPPPTAQPQTPPPAKSERDEPRPQTRPEPSKSTIAVRGQEEPKERIQGASLPSPDGSPTPNNAAAAPPGGGGHAIAVSRLKRMNLYNGQGGKVGDVERVVQSSDGNFHIVIGVGRFPRIRDRDVRIPLEQVTMRTDRLVAPSLTDEQVKIMPVFDGKDRTYRDVGRNTLVPMVRDESKD